METKCTYLELHSLPCFFRSCVSENDLPCVGGVVAWAAADAYRSHDGCQLRTAEEEEEGGGEKTETNTSINSAELDLKASDCNRSPISNRSPMLVDEHIMILCSFIWSRINFCLNQSPRTGADHHSHILSVSASASN